MQHWLGLYNKSANEMLSKSGDPGDPQGQILKGHYTEMNQILVIAQMSTALPISPHGTYILYLCTIVLNLAAFPLTQSHLAPNHKEASVCSLTWVPCECCWHTWRPDLFTCVPSGQPQIWGQFRIGLQSDDIIITVLDFIGAQYSVHYVIHYVIHQNNMEMFGNII